MRSIVFFILLLIFSNTNAQFVNTQTIGSNKTLYKSLGGLGADSAMIIINTYADTTAANLSVASKYFSIIRVGNSYYYRSLLPNKWNLITSSVSGGYLPNSDTTSLLNPYKTYYPRNAVSATGTGISYNSSNGQFSNTLPDRTVALTSGTGISVTGTYPNFTITNTSTTSGGTVTAIGTNANTGIYGGTITTTGTLSIDTLNVSTRKWRQKGVDSLSSVFNDTASALQGRIQTKQGLLTLTTTGTSGAATLTGSTLNIPQYSSGVVVSSGTYTPTATNAQNAGTITAYLHRWSRVGDIVTVTGLVEYYTTSSSVVSGINITLPVSTTFTNTLQASGAVTDGSSSTGGGSIYSNNVSGNTVTILLRQPTSGVGVTAYYTFQYQIL